MFWKLPWSSQSARSVSTTAENELGERLQEGEVDNSGDSNMSSLSLERTDCCEEHHEQATEVCSAAAGLLGAVTYQGDRSLAHAGTSMHSCDIFVTHQKWLCI